MWVSSGRWVAGPPAIFAAILAGLCSPPSANAGRMGLTYEEIERTKGPIVLAEVTEAQEVSRPNPHAPDKKDPGYAITLSVHEVLRGDLPARTIQIPFSSKGYAYVWEFDDRPKKGMKVLVFLKDGQGDQWNDFGLPDTIRPVTAFDEASVKTLRRILEFWAIQPANKREKALRDGCLGEDLGFRQYGAGVLQQRALRPGPEAPEVLSFLWEIYTDPRLDIATWWCCENAFANTFRSMGWQTYEPRYAILRSLVAKTWADTNQTAYRGGGVLRPLLAYEKHRGETLTLLATIAEGPREDVASGAAIYISELYEFFPADDAEKALNAKVLAAIAKLMGKPNSVSASSAAMGLARLVRDSVKMGLEGKDLAEFIKDAGAKEYPKPVMNWLISSRQALAAASQPRPAADTEGLPVVRHSLAAYVGKTVRLVGPPSWERTKEYGTAMEVGHCLVWLPNVRQWPFSHPNPDQRIQATGDLVQVEDIPVFRYEKGKPFGHGLPVPEPYSLKDMSRRLVLQNAKWEFLKP